jgi:hypothetical protein
LRFSGYCREAYLERERRGEEDQRVNEVVDEDKRGGKEEAVWSELVVVWDWKRSGSVVCKERRQ